MIQFAKRLVSKGLKVTVLVTIFSMNQMQAAPEQLRSFGFDVELISDGKEYVRGLESPEESTERFRRVTAQSLTELISNIKNRSKKRNDASTPGSDHDDANSTQYPELKFLVYHSGMSWALDVARQQGIDGAPFFTTSSSLLECISCHLIRLIVYLDIIRFDYSVSNVFNCICCLSFLGLLTCWSTLVVLVVFCIYSL
jgi:hypothetical protein